MYDWVTMVVIVRKADRSLPPLPKLAQYCRSTIL